MRAHSKRHRALATTRAANRMRARAVTGKAVTGARAMATRRSPKLRLKQRLKRKRNHSHGRRELAWRREPWIMSKSGWRRTTWAARALRCLGCWRPIHVTVTRSHCVTNWLRASRRGTRRSTPRALAWFSHVGIASGTTPVRHCRSMPAVRKRRLWSIGRLSNRAPPPRQRGQGRTTWKCRWCNDGQHRPCSAPAEFSNGIGRDLRQIGGLRRGQPQCAVGRR
jgi:hypothetical protein